MAVLTLANYLHYGFHIDNSYGILSTTRMIHDNSGAICYIVNALWDIFIDCEAFTQFFGFVSKVEDFVWKKSESPSFMLKHVYLYENEACVP